MKRAKLIHILSRAMPLLASLLLTVSAFGADLPEGLLKLEDPNVQAIIAVQNAVTKDLMALEDILGTAVGLDAQGQPALVIFVNLEGKHAAEIARALPKNIRGANVSVELNERFRALQTFTPMDGGPGHRVAQTPPIQLGTSGGWDRDLANGYCCGGTCGSLIQVVTQHQIEQSTVPVTNHYVLSNYHVYESDIAPGGNGIIAQTGDPVIQPGLIDVGCDANHAWNIATLVKLSSLPFNNVDAAIAQAIPGMIRADGSIIDIGTISSTTVAAALNQKVKKSGRTTGLTSSVISGLNATVSVAYDNECAGSSAFTKTFTGQILIKNRLKARSFISGGDSGSLMVQDVATNPKAIGLLFAGSSTTAVANPIGEVLNFVGTALGGTATMVGQRP